MATPSKDRQAAFKSRMRQAGLRQVTLWVTPEEAARLKSTSTQSPAPALPSPTIKEVGSDEAETPLSRKTRQAAGLIASILATTAAPPLLNKGEIMHLTEARRALLRLDPDAPGKDTHD